MNSNTKTLTGVVSNNLLVSTVGILAILAIIVLTKLFAPAAGSLPTQFTDSVIFGQSIILEAFPFVILGILISILVQIFIPTNWLLRVLPRNALLRRLVLSVTGFLLPVCECGNVPLARGLMLRGFQPSDAVTFLFAAPILNPITILTTQQVFGWDSNILWLRIVGGLLIANLLGFLTSLRKNEDEVLAGSFLHACQLNDHDHVLRLKDKISQSLTFFAAELSSMMPALLLGSLLAGVIQVFVPREILLSIGTDPVWSVLALMLLAFVISICSNVDAFFMLSFVGIFMPGGIIAFLLLGPVLDIKLLALLRTTFKAKPLASYSILVILVTAVIGMAANYFAI